MTRRSQAPDQADPVSRLIPDPFTSGAWIVRVNGTDQSFIDPADPTRLEFDYVQRIADHLDAQAPPGQRLGVVHIGGAGMTLARYVAATRPTSPQIVLEPDVDLTAQVRATVPLPRNSGIKVRPVDGRTGLVAMPDHYADVVIIDAYEGSSVPGELVTIECFQQVRRVLRGDGLVVANLTDSGRLSWTRSVLATLGEVFLHTTVSAEPATLKGRRFGNLVAGGSQVDLPLDELTRSAARSAFPYRVLAGTEMARFIGHARTFTDQAPQGSPPPAQTLTWYG